MQCSVVSGVNGGAALVQIPAGLCVFCVLVSSQTSGYHHFPARAETGSRSGRGGLSIAFKCLIKPFVTILVGLAEGAAQRAARDEDKIIYFERNDITVSIISKGFSFIF